MTGLWGDWSAWSECSRTCGPGGTHGRSRTCQGGELCKGPLHETKQCQLQDCPGMITTTAATFYVYYSPILWLISTSVRFFGAVHDQ